MTATARPSNRPAPELGLQVQQNGRPSSRAEGARRGDAGASQGAENSLLARISERVGKSRGWSRRAIACAAGACSVLAMAPVHGWPVLFLTLPVLVALLDAPPPGPPRWRSAAHDGWWFGFGYHFLGLFWIGEAFLVEAHIFGWLLPVAITLMPAGLAAFWAASLAAASMFWRPGVARLLVLAIVVSSAEYLRGHIFTGFPWNTLGYALTNDIVVMQSAALIGIYGLTALAVLIFASPLACWLAPKPRAFRAAQIGAVSLAPLLLLYAFGLSVLSQDSPGVVPGVKLRLVQPSVPQHDKWARDKQEAIFNDHLLLTRTNEAGDIDDAAGITHVVWPEAAMPFLPLATPKAIEGIAATLPEEVRLIAGALRLDRSNVGDEVLPGVRPDRRIFNSMLVFGGSGELVTLYDKLHLVPFGEYLPFADTLNAIGLQTITRIRGGFSVGPSPRPLLAIPGLPLVGPLICYEAIFPAAVVQGQKRPGLLINVTNDGWFGNLTGPFQHFHQSRLRAVEEGLPLVRVGNNGVSAMIDPYGRILKEIGLNVRGVADASLPHARPPTLYSRYGDATFLVVLIGLAIAACGLMAYPLGRHDA